MSIKVMTAVWDHSTAKGSELLMLLAIADHADDDGWCWPHRRTLAHRIRMSGDSVKRLTKALEERGELLVFRHGDEGRGSQYQVRLDAFSGGVQVAPPGGARAHRGGVSPAPPHSVGTVTETGGG